MSSADQTRIAKLRVRTVRLPVEPPHQTANGVITESPLVLTDVITTDGTEGHSIVFAYTPMALKATAELVMNLGQLVEGEPLAPSELDLMLTKKFRLLGSQGLVGMARAAIDMALWDALARTHHLPLVRLLGGVEKPIRAYGAVGFDGPLECSKVAESWAKRGFTGVKAKIGYPDVNGDVEVIRTMREACGDQMAIMVDYNQCLTPAEAIERLHVLDDEGLTWIEEPTVAHDFAGHARIAREIRTPIQCGENWWGVTDLQHAIDAEASDLLMPDVMKIGGVTGWLKTATLAESKGYRVSSHLWPEISARLMCCTPTAYLLEYADWWNSILKKPLEIRDGMAIVDDEPGSGIEWDEAAIERYRA